MTPLQAFAELKIQRSPNQRKKKGKKKSFLIDAQIQLSLVLGKVLMSPHPTQLRVSDYFAIFKIFFLTLP